MSIDIYACYETFSKSTKKYQRLDKLLSKYSKHSGSVIEIKDYYNELRYSEHSKSDKEIEE